MSKEYIPQTADEAWQHLTGKWRHVFKATNSVSEMRLEFTPDRKMIRSSSLSGGVLPMPMVNRTQSDVAKVAVKDRAVLLTLGKNLVGGPGGVLTLRFATPDQIAIEDGPTYTREA